MPIPAGPPATTGVTLADVKLRLDKSLNVDDDEIYSMITSAEAEYTLYVGPLPGQYTQRFNARAPFVLDSPSAVSVDGATYNDGTTVDVDTLDLDAATGIVDWTTSTSYSPFGCGGYRYLTITYTVGPLPASHVETIVADVAGYFATTQRGGSAAAFPGEDVYAQAAGVTPLILFPRIRALAPPRVG